MKIYCSTDNVVWENFSTEEVLQKAIHSNPKWKAMSGAHL